MTKKRSLAVAGVLAGIVCMGTVVLPALLPPRSGVTKANFDRIQRGMTRAEVEAILGGKCTPSSVVGQSVFMMHTNEEWLNPDGSAVWVSFSRDSVESVDSKEWIDATETSAEKLRRWFLHGPPQPHHYLLGTTKLGDQVPNTIKGTGAIGR